MLCFLQRAGTGWRLELNKTATSCLLLVVRTLIGHKKMFRARLVWTRLAHGYLCHRDDYTCVTWLFWRGAFNAATTATALGNILITFINLQWFIWEVLLAGQTCFWAILIVFAHTFLLKALELTLITLLLITITVIIHAYLFHFNWIIFTLKFYIIYIFFYI